MEFCHGFRVRPQVGRSSLRRRERSAAGTFYAADADVCETCFKPSFKTD